ncbi:Glutathione-regulated potassium-efflux system ancillary protein KefF [BD1-7 clade bacterium]|uniref:Glutathione-regulated potassium-efflux system ancillary protein KefF n=1 Tax=BD1-7 clade bacterium TaxID=2029982 RepID=A0A5S9MP90_9GAMM|nr:Glutathione-regulated potassium-efflux system ancillary protein KefF [BD1-7 clade bacterium]
MKHRILVIFSHPAIRQSRFNRYLLANIESLEGITIADLYEEYPAFHIDVAAERNRLQNHDVLVFQHPLLWFNCPSLMKEWLDRVLPFNSNACAYPHELAGKHWLSVVSSSVPLSIQADNSQADTDRSMERILDPFERIAVHCQMRFMRPWITDNTSALSTMDIHRRAEQYKNLLINIRDSGFDRSAAGA